MAIRLVRSTPVLMGLIGLLSYGPAVQAEERSSSSESVELTVRSGGNVGKVLKELLPSFEKQTGARVSHRVGGSGQMLDAAIRLRDADVYIAADLRHVRRAEQRGLVAAKLPLVTLHLALVVPKGNPKGIAGLADLKRPGMHVYTEDVKGCQLGEATQRLLKKNDIRIGSPDVRRNGKPPTLRTFVDFLNAGLLDAAIVWDATARQLCDQVQTIEIPPADNVAVNVVAVVLRFASYPELAQRLAVYLWSDRSRRAWEEQGFRVNPSSGSPNSTAEDTKRKRAAERMIRASQETLAPVYAPLAEQMTQELDLAEKTGIGIDVGSGPGDLIVELCKRTQLHWINADINPHFFSYFFHLAEQHGVAHRISAVYADAQALPFRDDYADVVVSRGSYPFWPDRKKGFAEVYRVLKPGGIAYVGRGFPEKLPRSVAQQVRKKQGGRIKYDKTEEAQELRAFLDEIGIPGYRVHLPEPPGGDGVNYGIWVEFRKPPTRSGS